MKHFLAKIVNMCPLSDAEQIIELELIIHFHGSIGERRKGWEKVQLKTAITFDSLEVTT